MNSNSNTLGKYNTNSENIPTEILDWFYKSSEDCIILVWDEYDHIKYISDNVEHLFSLRANELLEKKWTQYISVQQSEQIVNHFVISNDQLEIPYLQLSTEDGKKHTFHTKIDKIPIKSEQYYICKLKDITYEEKLKSILQDGEKLILAGQLSAGLVHEIRNPLTSIKGFLQLIQAGIEQREQYFNVMINEVEKLEKITSELLYMSKPFQNNPKLESVEALIQDVIFIMGAQSDLRNIHFLTHLEANLTTKCDAAQIKQVLINIIKNGAEAMDKSGIIKIQTKREGDYISIHIIDEGEGITDNMVKEVSAPFFTTKSDGTGLGLAVTNHILDSHQGKLRITSDEGLGTNFTILLPVANE